MGHAGFLSLTVVTKGLLHKKHPQDVDNIPYHLRRAVPLHLVEVWLLRSVGLGFRLQECGPLDCSSLLGPEDDFYGRDPKR